MSVRHATRRGRPHRPGSARARGTLSVIGAAGSLLVAAVVLAAVALSLFAEVSGVAALAAVMAGLCLAALALLGAAASHAVRGAMRPVERLNAELDGIDIEEAELGRRVSVPAAGGDAEELAGRVNVLLARLDRAVLRRRSFIADASHELRTPLTGLRTRIELALAAPEDGAACDTLRHSLDDIDRIHRIVDDLLVLSRMDSGDAPVREVLDIGALVESEVGRRDPPVPTTVKAERGLLVEVNRPHLCRVVLNLLANAERHATSLIEVEARAERGEAVVEVRDDGPGIPPADRDRVFERFTRLDSARSRADGGSGLGLAVAREMAVLYEGRLYVGESATGARLILCFPLVRRR
ncbi:sensor histidine kinase [Actinomadura livida]|uniref:histidine kinase n=1 Tax=Actinomadura livida TaxID=79909 RepID=A0A7W7N0E2_9ACTN|nr:MULTISPECIES: HAMP domain-containing sensor histidine kinase [Actinomadura]MBB4776840.1 signal transduction histidine kinase [Actinomadura catellatispora]GGT95263.1 hypothetical protein GCM10010208_18120 [Actinomadura livida]